MGIKETILWSKIQSYRSLSMDYFWLLVFKDAQFKTWVLDMIRQDQLFKKGIDGDGDIIGYYSAFTESINPTKREGTPYTLFDTGDFYRSMYIYAYKNYIEVDANPIKVDEVTGETENLFWKYGENIIALTEENMEVLRQQIKERYTNEIRKLLL